MIRINDSIQIECSPKEVFDYVADLDNIPKWQSEVVTSKVDTAGPVKIGTHFTEEVKMGPMRATASCEVTEYEPEKLLAFSAISSSMDYEGRITVEPLVKGTRLTLEGTADPKGFWRILQPFLKGEFRNSVRKELTAIKGILEQH